VVIVLKPGQLIRGFLGLIPTPVRLILFQGLKQKTIKKFNTVRPTLKPIPIILNLCGEIKEKVKLGGNNPEEKIGEYYLKFMEKTIIPATESTTGIFQFVILYNRGG
jgi:hypothetical protein